MRTRAGYLTWLYKSCYAVSLPNYGFLPQDDAGSGGSRRLIAFAFGAMVAVAPLAAISANAAPLAPPATGTLTASAASVANGSTITFTYSVPQAALTSTNWVGIYETGQTPGQVASTTWQYTPNASGTVTLNAGSLDGVGSYSAYFLYDNAYEVLAGPVNFQVTAGHPAAAPSYQRSIGHGALACLYGVAVAANGGIWTADTGHNRLVEFSPSGLQVLSATGKASSPLSHPEGVAVDTKGNVWAADTGNNRVVEFSSRGSELAAFGTEGSGNGQLDQPTALTVAPDGSVYVADQANNRIEEFTASGAFTASISVPTPAGVALDGSGDIWVSSPSYASGNSVYEFSAAGKKLTSFGSTQAGFGDLGNTGGIAACLDGRIYVTQPDYGFVTVLSTDGSFYTEFGLQSDPAKAARNLQFPQDIAFAANGDIWVADSGTSQSPSSSRRADPRPLPPPARGIRRPPAGRGPSVPLIVALSLLALGLGGTGAARLVGSRRARPGTAVAAAAAEPVMCEMPDPATAESFAAVQARVSSSQLELQNQQENRSAAGTHLGGIDLSRRCCSPAPPRCPASRWAGRCCRSACARTWPPR